MTGIVGTEMGWEAERRGSGYQVRIVVLCGAAIAAIACAARLAQAAPHRRPAADAAPLELRRAVVERVDWQPADAALVVQVKGPVNYSTRFAPADAAAGLPPRAFVDLHPAVMGAALPRAPVAVENALARRIRIGQFDAQTVRVVLDLAESAFFRVRTSEEPPRLYLTLERGGAPAPTDAQLAGQRAAPAASPVASRVAAVPPTSPPAALPAAKAAPATVEGKAAGRPAAEAGASPAARPEAQSAQLASPAERGAGTAAPGAPSSGGASSTAPVARANGPSELATAVPRFEPSAAAPSLARHEALPHPEANAPPATSQTSDHETASGEAPITLPPGAVRGPAEGPPSGHPVGSAASTAQPAAQAGAAEVTGGAGKGAPGASPGSLAQVEGEMPPTTVVPRPGAALKGASGFRRFTVVLDPGHGGKDPGAQALGGYDEKNITLAVAQLVAERLRGDDRLRVLLTRSDDSFVSLEQRTAIANAQGADLFISIHVNASENRELAGIETYTLNNTNDRATIRLAALENGLTLAGATPGERDLAYILSDLVQTGKEDESIALARAVHGELFSYVHSRWNDVTSLGVKKGPFYVLVGAYMPCVLVEVAFLSNEREGQRIVTRRYQQDVAEGIAHGIHRFLSTTSAHANL